MNKISEFKIAEYMIRLFSEQIGSPFVDLPIEFIETNVPLLLNNKLLIPKCDKLSKTLFQIVCAYVNNVAQIIGNKQLISIPNTAKVDIMNATVAMARDFTTSSLVFDEGLKGLPTALKLNRDPLVWMLMRDIICPAYHKPLSNPTILATQSAKIDAARYVEKETITFSEIIGLPSSVQITDDHEPFIVLNMQVENYPYREAYVLYEAIRSHGLNPDIVVRDLINKTELSSKFAGLVKMAIADQSSISDFFMMLGILSGFNRSEESGLLQRANKIGKVVQAQAANSHSSFWQLGLIEKQLEPARGMDWSVYFRMKPVVERLWNKVEKEKRKRGLKELPFELLLRVQSEDYKTDPTLIMQALLADNRVW